MEDELRENPRLLVIVLATAAVAVGVFAIFLLILVWTPDTGTDALDNPREVKQKLGTFTRQYINEKDVVERYCKDILNIFASGNMDLVKRIVLPEYLEFRNITSSDLQRVLTQKGVLGKTLDFTTYSALTHPKYGRVYEVNVQAFDGSYSDKMLIIQKSPNDYKVSFDGFVGLSKETKSVTRDGLKLEIKEIKELTTVTTVKFTLTNESGRSIFINKENNYENVYLKLITGSEIRMNSSWLSGQTLELTNGYVVNLDAEFVTSGFSSGSGKSIVIKNIYDSLSKENKDIEFPLY